MVKGFIFFRDGKIPFVIENYRMELFTDDSLLDDFCKEYNFKENYILHGQCFDIGIRGRKATFLVENSIGSTCYLRCYTINMFDKDEEYDSIGLQSPSLDEVFRCEYEYIDMVRAGINLAIEPKVVYKVPFGMNDQKYELEFRIGHDNRLGLLEDLDRKCELILPLHTNEIVLTPRHICDLFCDLLNIQTTDIVLDPCCGTAGFLVAAMHHMLEKAGADQNKRKNIKKKQLHGFELQSNMFAIAATNMILRDDGNSNIKCEDFLRQNPAQVQLKGATVGMMNPPYSQGTKSDPSQYELSFVEHLLDSLTEGARAAVIVPQSSMTGKTKDEQTFKENILKHHTLEGVITCNTDTFYGVGTNPVIAIFTAHEPHPEDKVCKFIDFRDDGYEVRAHIGLIEGDSAKDKRQHLLDVWFGRTEAASKFCVESTVKAEDEWLHSFFYFNDEIPADADFEKAIGDYLTFEFSMIMQNREYLFGQGGEENAEP